ncbi:MAG: SpoIIE family protein phosphatase [Spirochaetales bacterium]|nr:SpoIIE family protein phosphatase [Spirochaetales bacterium]
MKKLIFIFTFISVSLQASPDRLDLLKICESAESRDCVHWFVGAAFDPEMHRLQASDFSTSLPQGWQRIKNFPVWVNRLPQVPESDFAEYTFLVFFDWKSDVAEQPGLLLREIGEAFEIYLNGHLVAREGIVENSRVKLHRTVRGVVYDLDRSYFRPGQNLLLFRIMGDPRYDHTGFYASQDYLIGPARELRAIEMDRIGLALIVLYLFVGLYHLLLAWRRPQDRYNLFFGLFCAGLFIYLITRNNVVFEPWPYLGAVDTILIQRVELVVLYMIGPLLFSFLDTLCKEKIHLFTRIVSIFGALLIPPTVFLPIHQAEFLLRIWQATMPLNIIYFLYRPIRSIYQGNQDARRLMVGIAVLIVTISFDILDSAVFQTGYSLTKYGFLIFIVGIATVLAARFLRVHNEVEELNQDLERKVEERTLELQKSLNEVRELKVQQDGDYYLTSLLIHPLGGNFARSENVDIDMLVRQKKRFTFRKWESEIGGDLCTAHTIELKGRAYTVFLNGDAMGKSMQGAGGALVLGVVFKSVINRTRLSSHARNKRPERWLKDCFVELQNIFVTFDGSMLISAVMGLVDDENGLMYYINAEHPWVVLYREGRASFIEESLLLRKIGISGLEGFLQVRTFPLRQGDVIIVGSDGRDDILDSVDAAGSRVINEDEYLFLKRVEEGRGLLPEVENAVLAHGALTDDFTMVRIAYKEDRPLPEGADAGLESRIQSARLRLASSPEGAEKEFLAILADHPANSEVLLELARHFYKQKEYSRAAEMYLRYVEGSPADTEILVRAAFSCKLAGRLDDAIDLGESVRLRQRAHANNLINLADAYRLDGNRERAHMILEEARNFDPENEQLKKLSGLLPAVTE